MSPSPRSGTKAVPRVKRGQPRREEVLPQLNAEMPCDTAFRIVARRCLADLNTNHEATCNGDPDALHQMRVALTRLRTAILFFSPMVSDSQRTQIRQELKWMNRHLGAVRDLDVAIERLKFAGKQRSQSAPNYRSYSEKRAAEGHRHLTQAFRSARYRRLIESISAWVDNGPWSVKMGKQATQERASQIAVYGAAKLTEWQQKLLKKSRKLPKMDRDKRHRLRLLNKKLNYSIDSLKDLFADRRFSRQQAGLKYLRKAQKSLGQLNDDAIAHSLATALARDGVQPALPFLSPEREKRLIRTAATAYRKLATMKP
jgi:CHAD domain-containing protein